MGHMKEIFRISPERVADFTKQVSKIVPPKPILTRWGTWIDSALIRSERTNLRC